MKHVALTAAVGGAAGALCGAAFAASGIYIPGRPLLSIAVTALLTAACTVWGLRR